MYANFVFFIINLIGVSMSISVKLAHFASVAKDYGIKFGTSVKAGVQAAYQEMTIANARIVLTNAKEYTVTAYNNITIENAKAKLNEAGIVFCQYKGRYIELINNDQHFAIANVATINVTAFFAFEKMANRIGQMIEFTFKPFRLVKEAALHAGFGYAIFKTNALFCQTTGFYMSDNTMKAIAIGALVVRIINQYNPESNRKFADVNDRITQLQKIESDNVVLTNAGFNALQRKLDDKASKDDLTCAVNSVVLKNQYAIDQSAQLCRDEALGNRVNALDVRLKKIEDAEKARQIAFDTYIN